MSAETYFRLNIQEKTIFCKREQTDSSNGTVAHLKDFDFKFNKA